jgi:glycine cleavage system H protein
MVTIFRGPDETWVLVDGESARVGVTSAVAGVRGVALPSVGVALARGETAVRVRGLDGQRDVGSPVAGTVVLVNDALVDDPASLESDPLGSGWLYEVQLAYDEVLEGLVAESTD